MAESLSRSPLPKVTSEDLAQILFEDITDTSHIKRWHDFAESNPTLAREVLVRAYNQIHHARTDIERVKITVDLLSFAIRALETAQQRIANDVDDGDVSLRP